VVGGGGWEWHGGLIGGIVVGARSCVTGAGFLGPQAGKIKKLTDERGPADPEVQQRIRRVLFVARIDNLLLLLVVLDMALKPGL
jgi:hypothetical protein